MVPGVYEGSRNALLVNSEGDKQFLRELVKSSYSKSYKNNQQDATI
jgi:hypothetical protein